MSRLRIKLFISFLVKVLVPVIVVMVLLLAITVRVVNERITQQFEVDAKRTLATADAVFRNSQQLRLKNLLLRFKSLPNEPRYKAIFQTGHRDTLREFLKESLGEQDMDVALLTSDDGELLAGDRRNPSVSIKAFEAACDSTIRRALQGEEKADTVRVADRLYDVVSIPVTGVGDVLIGVLTFGSEINPTVVQEFKLMTHSEITLLADGQVIATSLESPAAVEQFPRLIQELCGTSSPAFFTHTVTNVVLGNEHYFCSGGQITPLGSRNKLEYLLLSSYEQPLRALQETKKLLLNVSLAAILVGATVVWLIVRKITAPLRELRDSAEAVGRGDFSRRVEVRTHDECGELARVFNQMTQNLKQSREQLEQTVETLKTTQAQLIQSEKLSGIGEFVAGVAHELNNPLTSVMGFSELLRQTDQARSACINLK